MSRPATARARARRASTVCAVLLAAVAATPHLAPAQSFADRLRRKAEDAAKRAVEARVERRAAEGTRGAMDAAEQGAKRAVGGGADSAAGTVRREPTSATTTAAATTAAGAATTPPAARPGEGAWANYDFVPGERVLFADDFAGDAVGDFPRRLQFKEGSMEVVEWRGRRLLRATAGTNRFLVNLPAALPERFTLEFDYANPVGHGWGGLLVGFGGKDPAYATGESRLTCNHDEAGVTSRELKATKAPAGDLRNAIFRCRLMVDGAYAKAYVNEQRVANAPNAAIPRGRQLFFVVSTREGEKNPALIGDLRVAAGGRRLYDAIAAAGRVATQGIYFDVGSDRVRPESTPTLKEIAAMLADHPELKLAIEGHTDAAGQAGANMTLSEQRAAAVKAALVEQFGADAARLTSKGLGQTAPTASNGTPEGRQQNRRVELVRR